MKCIAILLFTLFGHTLFCQTSTQGKVTVAATGEELIGANIVFMQNGAYKGGVSTDFDGNYSLIIDPGTYDVEASYIGFSNQLIEKVIIIEEISNTLNFALEINYLYSKPMGCGGYKIPLIEKDYTTSGQKISASTMRILPSKKTNEIIMLTPGVSTKF